MTTQNDVNENVILIFTRRRHYNKVLVLLALFAIVSRVAVVARSKTMWLSMGGEALGCSSECDELPASRLLSRLADKFTAGLAQIAA